MKKKLFIQFSIFLLSVSLSFIGYLKYPTLFALFEHRLNDLMFIARGEKKADENVIIIDIDEKSLKEIGQWPWSRDDVAIVLQNLAEYGIGIVGLDVVFAERDNSSPKNVFKKLGKPYEDIVDYDEILAQTIASTPTIIGYVFGLNDDGVKPENSPKINGIFIERNKPKSSYLIKPYRPILNIPIIQENAYSNGYFNTIPDRDGIVRSIPMVMEYDGVLYPALTLEMIRIALGIEKVYINYFDKGVESIQMGELTIPTDRFGRLMVNYKGEQKQYKYISISDVYKKRIPQTELEGKIALLGTSAAGLLDLRSTPFDNVYPGVEVHATALDNIINKEFLSKPSWILALDLLSIVVVGALAFGITLIPNALLSFSSFVFLTGSLIYTHYFYMMQKGLLLNTFFPLASIVLIFLIGESINYFFETKQKDKIKKKFAAKVSSAVVEELIKNPQDNVLEGKEEEITIFFSDIRGFTSLSESMSSAKELIAFLNEYMTPMVNIITEHKGTVDKFIGDAIMAYWNAPVQVSKHADEALKASIEQILALQELNKKLKKEDRPQIAIGIGLNSGVSVVGEMGSSGRSDFTCIGDSVNLASRVEGLCKPYGAQILLTEFTKELLQEENYLLRELDVVRVKGKEEPVSIYECIGDKENSWVEFDQEDIHNYNNALKQYKSSHFIEAKELFIALFVKNEQKLYKMYIERCEHYIQNPPQEFDGVFTFTTK